MKNEIKSESEDPNIAISALQDSLAFQNQELGLSDCPIASFAELIPRGRLKGSDGSCAAASSLFSGSNKSDDQSEIERSDKRLQKAWQKYSKLARSHRRKFQQYKRSKSLLASLRKDNNRLLQEARTHFTELQHANKERTAQAIELNNTQINADRLQRRLADTDAKFERFRNGLTLIAQQFADC